MDRQPKIFCFRKKTSAIVKKNNNKDKIKMNA